MNWLRESANWAPNISMVAYQGNPTRRKMLQTDLRTVRKLR